MPPSRNNVRCQLILDECNPVAQDKLALFQALNLDKIGTRHRLQRSDRSVKIAMFLAQSPELCLQLAFFFFGHSQPPNFQMPYRGLSTFGLSARSPEILPANTTIDPAVLPESLPQDQVVGERTSVFVGGLRHLDHTKNFSEHHELWAVR